MTILADIVAGIKTRLDTIDGLRVYDHVPADPNLPAAVIVPPEINYRETMRAGVIRLQFEIVLLTSSADHQRGQRKLFPYLDWGTPESILDAIDADRDLGLTNVDAAILNSRPLGLEEVAAFQAFGASFSLLVAFTNT